MKKAIHHFPSLDDYRQLHRLGEDQYPYATVEDLTRNFYDQLIQDRYFDEIKELVAEAKAIQTQALHAKNLASANVAGLVKELARIQKAIKQEYIKIFEKLSIAGMMVKLPQALRLNPEQLFNYLLDRHNGVSMVFNGRDISDDNLMSRIYDKIMTYMLGPGSTTSSSQKMKGFLKADLGSNENFEQVPTL